MCDAGSRSDRLRIDSASVASIIFIENAVYGGKDAEEFLVADSKSRSPIARELPEAQFKVQGFKPMLKTSLFCTFLVDLRHKNPVLKFKLAATVETQE